MSLFAKIHSICFAHKFIVHLDAMLNAGCVSFSVGLCCTSYTSRQFVLWNGLTPILGLLQAHDVLSIAYKAWL